MIEKNIKNQNMDTKRTSFKLKKEIKSIFSLFQGLICIYFLWMSFTGFTNKVTNGYLFEYVNWIDLFFYIISAITSFYFFSTNGS